MANDTDLKNKVNFLEHELRLKDAEIARYRAELSKANVELERIISDLGQELRMASKIQKILSPTEIPNIPGFEFSSKFYSGTERGGDYFDIFEHEDKMKFGIVLANSSGYSMSALFLSVLIKLSSQIEARKGMSAELVLAQMAKELVPSVENLDTASVFYGVMDRRSFEFNFSSSGALMSFLLPHGSDTITRLLPSTGPFKKEYSEKPKALNMQFNARDRLILCTEGVLEAENSSGEAFGVDRLSNAILKTIRSGVHEVRNEILFQVQQFSGLDEPVRDQTVIVMEVKDRVIKLAKN
jgi:sigma-B regulation protein RsbU (phosphoserine phosphatase)